MPHYSVFTFSTDWLTNGRLLLTMLPLYYCQTLNVTMMLRFDDILLIFVELYRQPEEKHPLWCSHYVSKNWNKNSGVGPAKKVRVWDPGQSRLHYKGYSQCLPHHSIQVDILGHALGTFVLTSSGGSIPDLSEKDVTTSPDWSRLSLQTQVLPLRCGFKNIL